MAVELGGRPLSLWLEHGCTFIFAWPRLLFTRIPDAEVLSARVKVNSLLTLCLVPRVRVSIAPRVPNCRAVLIGNRSDGVCRY